MVTGKLGMVSIRIKDQTIKLSVLHLSSLSEV